MDERVTEPVVETPSGDGNGDGDGDEKAECISGYTPDDKPASWDIVFRAPAVVTGGNHRVRRGTNRSTRQDIGEDTEREVAQKIVRSIDENVVDRLTEEIETLCNLLSALDNKYALPGGGYPRELTRLIGFDDTGPSPDAPDRPFVLMSSQKNGKPLGSWPIPFERGEWKKFAKSLFRALCWLEFAQIVHRDLTPGNMLWDGDNVMIIDFGHACRIGATRAGVDNPPWSMRGSPEPKSRVRPAEDVVRACMIVLHVATGKSPQMLHRGLAHADFSGDPELLKCFGDVFTEGANPTAREILERLEATPPQRDDMVTRQPDQGVKDGWEEFYRLYRRKEELRRPPRSARHAEATEAAGPAEVAEPVPPPGHRSPRAVLGVVAVLMVVFVLMIVYTVTRGAT